MLLEQKVPFTNVSHFLEWDSTLIISQHLHFTLQTKWKGKQQFGIGVEIDEIQSGISKRACSESLLLEFVLHQNETKEYFGSEQSREVFLNTTWKDVLCPFDTLV